jgi:transposase
MTQAVLHPDGITHQRKLHLALELSNAKWLLAFADGTAASPKIHQVDAGDLVRLSEKIAVARKAFGFGPDSPVVTCYEAGRDGFWIHRALAQRGIRNVVVEPSCLAANRPGRQPKTDNLDAKALVEMLVRFERGERNVWRIVRVPTEAEEDARRLVRRRERLIRDRVRYANSIQSALKTHGIRVERVSNITPGHLDGLKRWDGTPLPKALRGEVDELVALLAQVKTQLKALEDQLQTAVEVDPLSQALMLVKGIGQRGAQTLATEFFWRKFENRRQVGSLAGLVGTPFQSGSMAREKGISKAGNRRVRRVMVELAWLWTRHQKASGLGKWYHERIGAKPTARQKRVAIVALARRLLILLWRYVTTGELPSGVVLKDDAQPKKKSPASAKKAAKPRRKSKAA